MSVFTDMQANFPELAVMISLSGKIDLIING